ncbi:MAG TPA: FliH/SctL family protein [Fimbriimonadaceae bacterium]|nr:FliH/SctL family protein [Fimbriimonadaceae bacterium]
MSSGSILRGEIAATSFTAILPNLMPTDLQVAVRREGKGGRTIQAIENLRQASMNSGYDDGFAKGVELGLIEGEQRAYREAYDKAYQEAQSKNEQLISQFADELGDIVASVLNALRHWTEASEEKLTDFASEIARRVLVSELNVSRESILAIVKEAVAEVTHSEHARICVSPVDCPLIEKHREEILSATSSIKSLAIVSSPSIQGGCRIETDGGQIDATLDGKLAQLDDELGEAA